MHCKFTERLAWSLALGVLVMVACATVLSHITIFQSTRSLFMTDSLFAGQMLAQLGGAERYVTAFVGALCQWTWLGAAAIGLMVGVVSYLLVGRGRWWWLALIPILYLLGGYELTDFLAGVVGVWLVVIVFAAWRSVGGVWCSLALMPLALVAGFVICPSAFLVLVILMAVELFFDARLNSVSRLVSVVVLGAIAWSLPWLSSLVFVVNPALVASCVLGSTASHLDWVFFVLLFLVAVISHLGWPRFLARGWVSRAMCGAVIVVGVVSLAFTFRPALRLVMLTQQALDHEQWEEVLRLSDKQALDNPLVQYMRTVALFRQGQLVDKIFDTPQILGPGVLFIPWQMGNNALQIKLSDLAWANVGIVNEALRLSFESMSGSGANRVNVAHLAHYNRLLGRQAVAERFEKQLSRTLFYDPKVPLAKFTPGAILRGGVDSIYTSTDDPTASLQHALAVDSTNRAAADYLALVYLLSTDLRSFVAMAPRLAVLYGGRLPRVYQEALVLYRIVAAKDSAFVLENYAIDRSVLDRVKTFNSQARDVQNMSADNRRSYWYYMLSARAQ